MNSRPPSSAAFSLVEVALALGVAAFSLLAILGLLASGEQVNHTATEQTASTDILTAVAADLRATPTMSGTSPQFAINIPANPVGAPIITTLYFDSTGQLLGSVIGSRYRLVVTFLSNGGGRTATLASLRATWPAAADPTAAATGNAEIFIALDRN